jgi:hypothetical protein
MNIDIESDIFVDFIYKTGISNNKKLLFTILYNLIPAIIFAPILLYKGYMYRDIILIIFGLSLFIADSMHFIKAIGNINN